MNGWSEILGLGISVRPFDGPKPFEGGAHSPFSAGWSDTVELLSRELRMLSAKRIVLELDVQESDLRLDGMPRATARMGSDAVRISFESRHGPVRIETGEYNGWQANVRAIAKSLEALRAVDRYGVSKRGEQYRGWRQIPSATGNPEDAVVTRENALEVLARTLNLPLNGVTGSEAEIRRALRFTHPDREGGDEVKFRMVVKARAVLES